MNVLAQVMDRGDMHDGSGWGWGWIVGVVFMVVLVVLAVVVIVRLTSSTPTAQPPSTDPPRRTAEDVLAERLARGEIEPAEYRQRLEALRSG